MNLRSIRLFSLFAVTLLLSALVAGCSTSHYKKNMPSIDYSSVQLSLNVKASEMEKYKIASYAEYAYGENGARLSNSQGVLTAKYKDRYNLLFFCDATATSATVDFYDAEDNFVGCATVKLPSMGKDLNVSVDIDTITPASAVPSKYSLEIKELSSSPVVGGDINLEAILTTPEGKQVVTDNSAAEFISSDNTIASGMGNGSFHVLATGNVTLTVKYNQVFNTSKSYTITE